MVLRALRSRNGRLLLAETFVNELGDWSLMIGAAIWVQQLTGSVGLAGLVYVALLLPTFGAPLSGLLADRVSRRGILLTTNAVMAVLVLALLSVRSGADVWIVLAVLVCNGVAATIYGPARSALVATLFTHDELGEVGGATVAVQQAMRLLAPAVGAGALVVVGARALAIGDATTYVLADLLLLGIRGIPPMIRGLTAERWVRAVFAGWRHIAGSPILRWAVAVLVPCALVGGGIDTVGLSVTVRTLGLPASFFAVLTAGQGVGAILAALVTAAALRRMQESPLLGIGLVIVAVGVAAWCAPNWAVAVAGSVVWGFGVTWVFAAAGLLPQRHAPETLLGRTAAAISLSITGAQAVGAVAASALVDAVPPTAAVLLLTSVFLVAGIVLLVHVRRHPAALGGRGGSDGRTPS